MDENISARYRSHLIRSVLFLCLFAVFSCGGGGGGGTTDPSADTAAPSVPQGLLVSLASATSASLSWSASSDNTGVSGYRIYRGGSILRSEATLSATDVGLAALTQYCYSISAFDGSGNESAQCSPVCVTTGDGVAPTVPTGLSVTAAVSGQLELTWNAATDDVSVTAYQIYRDGILLSTATTTRFTDSGLSPATKYCYAVSASDAGGNASAQSAQVCGTSLWAVTTLTCVPQGYTLGSAAIAYDAQHNAHIGFSGQNAALNYATNASGTWAATLVQQGTTEGVADVAIAVDANGSPHISFYSFADFITQTKDLRYATSAGGNWAVNTVDSAGDVGRTPSIAVDTSAHAHICYYDVTNQTVRYANNVLGWMTALIDSGGPYCFVGVAPDDGVHISYGSNQSPYPLRYKLYSAGASTLISNGVLLSAPPLMAFDQSGTVYIGYRSGTVLEYVTNDGSPWTKHTVDINSIGDTMLAAQDGSVHFYATGNYYPAAGQPGVFAFFHYTNASGTWTDALSVIDNEDNVPLRSIAVEGNGRVHVVYHDNAGTCLKYATNQ